MSTQNIISAVVRSKYGTISLSLLNIISELIFTPGMEATAFTVPLESAFTLVTTSRDQKLKTNFVLSKNVTVSYVIFSIPVYNNNIQDAVLISN